MAILSGLSIVTALLFGIFGALAVHNRSNALVDARANSEQLVRIQSVHTNLVKATAGASNEYLTPAGADAVSQRRAYTDGVADASRFLAAAAAANPDDQPALSTINDKLTQYTGLIESARASNRQGQPVGRAYLKAASAKLNDEVLPALDQLVSDNDVRVHESYDASDRASTFLWLFAGLAFVVLTVAQIWLFARTRRIFNISLVAAVGAVVLATALGGSVMVWAQNRGITTRDGPYEATYALAQARIGAFSAKADESAGLIAEGNGAGFEASYTTHAAAADLALTNAARAGADTSPAKAFAAYRGVHGEIRKLDDGGDHGAAVARATTSEAFGSNASFATFVKASDSSLQTEAGRITDGLTAVDKPLLISTWLIAAAGLLAAVASWWGFSVRLEEYR